MKFEPLRFDANDLNFTLDVCPPDWALLAALAAVAVLLAVLAAVVLWPLDSGLYLETEDPNNFDPMAQPLGDQPLLPPARLPS